MYLKVKLELNWFFAHKIPVCEPSFMADQKYQHCLRKGIAINRAVLVNTGSGSNHKDH